MSDCMLAVYALNKWISTRVLKVLSPLYVFSQAMVSSSLESLAIGQKKCSANKFLLVVTGISYEV